MSLDLSTHPCFSEGACSSHGRIHLPVAKGCNVQCKFCNRKYDCVNESRPGVTSSILSPGQAVAYLNEAKQRVDNIAVVGIAGPGDPFANPDATMETLRRVRADDPNVLLCVATNGLAAAPYVEEMARLDVSHLTVTVCGVDPKIVGQIYSWVRHERKVYRGLSAGETILAEQLKTIALAKKHHLLVKVNCIVVPGVNEHHVLEVAKAMKELDVDLFNPMALCHVPGSEFEEVHPPSSEFMSDLMARAEEYLPQMRHCQRCRADAVGKLKEDHSIQMAPILQSIAGGPVEPGQARPYVAVATREGFFVNQHLGEAGHLEIFEPAGAQRYRKVADRTTPNRGGGDHRWQELADVIDDCRAVLVSGVGRTPKRILTEQGVSVVEMEGLIDEGLTAVYSNQPVRNPVRCATVCGASCSGDGGGCG